MKDKQFYDKIHNDYISPNNIQNRNKINLIFTAQTQLKWHYNLAAYLQQYHSKSPNVKYYVCTPSNMTQRGAYNDTKRKKTNGFLKYIYGVQCRHNDTSAEKPIKVSVAVALIKNGLQYLIQQHCKDTQKTYFIFHPGKKDNSGYFTYTCRDHLLKEDRTTQNAKQKNSPPKQDFKQLVNNVFDKIILNNGNIKVHSIE